MRERTNVMRAFDTHPVPSLVEALRSDLSGKREQLVTISRVLEDLNRNRTRNLRPPDGQEHSLIDLWTLLNQPSLLGRPDHSSSIQEARSIRQDRTFLLGAA